MIDRGSAPLGQAVKRANLIPMATPWLHEPTMTLERTDGYAGTFARVIAAAVDDLLPEGPLMVCVTSDEPTLPGCDKTIAGHLTRHANGHLQITGRYQEGRRTVALPVDLINRIEIM